MWLKRLVRKGGDAGPVVVVAPPEFGGLRLFTGLASEGETLVRVRLTPSVQGDPVAQGNRLAEAVAKAYGRPLLHYALPFQVGIDFLRRRLDLLGPLCLAVGGAEHGPDFARHALSLQRPGGRVLLSFGVACDAFEAPRDALVLREDDLRLSFEEARDLAPDDLTDKEVDRLLDSSHGAIETFLKSLPSWALPGLAQLPPGWRDELTQPQAAADLEVLLELMMARERWIEALEVAAQHLSERLPEVLGQAGHAYLQRGLHARLWHLLRPYALQDETVLFWRLSAATRLGLTSRVSPEVDRYLDQHEAPELRALRAGTLAGSPRAREEAARACRASRTPLTLFQYGRLHGDTTEGLALLRDSVKLAEGGRHDYEAVRNAGALAGKLTAVGRYREAAAWGAWALGRFERGGLGDATRRLMVLNNWAFARILVGEIVGLDEVLHEAEQQLDEAFPRLSWLVRSTVADYHLAAGRAEEARVRYEANLELADRPMVGRAALCLVRVLLEMGDGEAAVKVAREAHLLTKDDGAPYRRFGELALGMALATSSPGEAVPLLESAMKRFSRPLQAYRQAQAALFLARGCASAGLPERGPEVLRHAQVGLNELSETGMTLLSGPEADFRKIWATWLGGDARLELRFLGRQEVWLDHQRLALSRQARELLAVLALKPEGLSLDQLVTHLSGRRDSKRAVTTALSRLRAKVRVSEQPYRIAVNFNADFLQVKAFLQRGEIGRAVELYRGPLLEESEAACVLEARRELEEMMREAVLASGDAELLYAFSGRLRDDVELWEATLEALPEGDPRTLHARARLRQELQGWDRD